MINGILISALFVLAAAIVCWSDGINTYCQNTQTGETVYFMNKAS